ENPRVRLARRDIVMHSRRSNGGNHHWVNIQSAGWVNIQSAQTRYQLLARYYDAYRKQLGLRDFSPTNQDRIAIQQIRERGALPLIQAGQIQTALERVKNIWASLPGAGYGQPEHSLAKLLATYQAAGGEVATAVVQP
ncbi:glycoside hydrolase family 24 protein, partial [Chitinimonas sp. PSY-7]|uniref:glycoside hydrolase family 24 protein n=1 Tax=Chitinimonas sp. PSY-7 TaxID=3459088 RepID=UPI00403FE0FA